MSFSVPAPLGDARQNPTAVIPADFGCLKSKKIMRGNYNIKIPKNKVVLPKKIIFQQNETGRKAKHQLSL